MSTFSNMRLTSEGQSLLAQAHNGTQLVIREIVFGGGEWSPQQQVSADLTELVDCRVIAPVSGVEQHGGQATINCVLTNAGLTEGFNLTEIGVIAQTDDGDVLYMTDYVPAAKSTWIPPEAEILVEVPVATIIACSSDYDVQVVINHDAPVTVADLEAHNTAPDAHEDIRALLEAVAPADHAHVIEDVEGLHDALEAKAQAGHAHDIGDVEGLEAALNSKAVSGHGHGISEVSGLQAALNGKLAKNGKAADAAKLNGYFNRVDAYPGSIVRRDNNGNIFAHHVSAEHIKVDHGVSGAGDNTIFYASKDDYIRKVNVAGMRTSLGLRPGVDIARMSDIPVGGLDLGKIKITGIYSDTPVKTHFIPCGFRPKIIISICGYSTIHAPVPPLGCWGFLYDGNQNNSYCLHGHYESIGSQVYYNRNNSLLSFSYRDVTVYKTYSAYASLNDTGFILSCNTTGGFPSGTLQGCFLCIG